MITAYTWAQQQKANAYESKGNSTTMSASDRQAGAAALKRRLERRRG